MKLTGHTEAELIANIKRCPRYNRCNRNQCPLDYDLSLRAGGNPCPWTRNATEGRRGGKIVRFGGQAMPDDLLIHVPQCNVARLNAPSAARWRELVAG